MSLSHRRCRPCDARTPRLGPQAIAALRREVPAWTHVGERLERQFTFASFTEAIAFVNRMAALAEAEDHHPDFRVHDYRRVDVSLTTQAIGALSENDFILAAKIDALCGGAS